MQTITKVRKNTDGNITDIMLDDGSTWPIEQAIQLVKEHKIEGVNVGKSRSGKEFLRANPDGYEENNLDQMPTF